MNGPDHDPDNDVRKIIYDCVDFRIKTDNEEDEVYLIINQHGLLGTISKTLFKNELKFVGQLNQASMDFIENNFGCTVCDTFDECIKSLTNAHVQLFHSFYKKLKELK